MGMRTVLGAWLLVVVTISAFQDQPLLLIGIAPPPFERKPPAKRDILHRLEGRLRDIGPAFSFPDRGTREPCLLRLPSLELPPEG